MDFGRGDGDASAQRHREVNRDAATNAPPAGSQPLRDGRDNSTATSSFTFGHTNPASGQRKTPPELLGRNGGSGGTSRPRESQNFAQRSRYTQEAGCCTAEAGKKTAIKMEPAQMSYEDQMKWALEASQQQPGRAKQDIIDLLSDSEEDAKVPAKKMEVEANPAVDEGAQIEEALRLSLEESQRVKSEEDRYKAAIAYRTLTRPEFADAVDTFVSQNGGYDKIESGMLIKQGNANDMKQSCVVQGGGKNQSGAQYGRYTIEAMWRVFDVLEGKCDLSIENPGVAASASRAATSKDGGKTLKREREDNTRLVGLPGAKVKAFLDVGHGLGIQVLQAAWALGLPARGVEIMKGRHLCAEFIRDGVLESLRNDPPDSSLVELKLEDFSRAFVPSKETLLRDEGLRDFLLFHDMSEDVQSGLVIFVNNAEEVFGARSAQKEGSATLDSHLGPLFANMKVGGRIVTLTDISGYLTGTGWFQRDVFESGTCAVSWGRDNKSIKVFVLTKLSDKWSCKNQNCPPEQNNVVDENGDLVKSCVFCNAAVRSGSRIRKPSKRAKGEEKL